MTHRKLKWALGLASLLAGCNALKLAPAPTAGESRALERQFRMRSGPAEVQFMTRDRADAVKTKLLSAFMDESLSVNSTQGEVIEAKLPTDREMGVDYAVVARAILLPLGDSTQVRLYGERVESNAARTEGKRVDAGTYGRGGATWLSLLKIAMRLQPDSTRRTVVTPE